MIKYTMWYRKEDVITFSIDKKGSENKQMPRAADIGHLVMIWSCKNSSFYVNQIGTQQNQGCLSLTNKLTK